MNKIDAFTDAFRARLDAFIIGCDSLEDVEFWDKSEYGEMDAYYLNELVTVILRIIAADGVISEKEAEYINLNFGFSYTPEELKDIYENCQFEINDSFEERILNDIELMRSANVKLVDEFKSLIELICDIIAASDETVPEEERKELASLKELTDKA